MWVYNKQATNVVLLPACCCVLFFYSSGLKSPFPTPQMGQTQSSGMSSNAVPAAMPLSGSPVAGS